LNGLGLNTADPTTLVVDLNCAFASIEQQHDPSLRGKPVAIGAYTVPSATMVSSSREARALGIKTGMKVFEGLALCPELIVRDPNPPLYRQTSDGLMDILRRHSPDVLRMSIDEASVDLAGTPGLAKLGPEGVARDIKRSIRAELGECITASIGISTSIWMAKQASNLDKIDGLRRIDHRNLREIFARLRLTDLSGIAEASARRLAKAGVLTPLEFLDATPEQLRAAGMHEEVAKAWLRRLHGYEVAGFEGVDRKSYSHSHVMAQATADQGKLEELLMRLSEMVGRRLRAGSRRGTTVSVSVVYRPIGGHFSRQRTLPAPVATGEEIYRAALELLRARDPRLEVGTLGVGISGLTAADSGQLDLFSDSGPRRGDRLEAAMDAIRDRFGDDALQRGRLLGRARVVRDRIAFGNTGHPDESAEGT
jgi:DNA polymerase IV